MRILSTVACSLLLLVVGCGSGSNGGGGGSGGGGGGGSGGDGGGGGGGGGGSGGTPLVGGIFGQPEPWSKDVSGLTKDARSDAIIAALDSLGGWGNGNKLQIDFSIPLFFGDGSTPRQTITAPPAPATATAGPTATPCRCRCRCPPTATPKAAPTTPATPRRTTATSSSSRPRRRSSTSSTTRQDRQRLHRARRLRLGLDQGLPRQPARRPVHLRRRGRLPHRRALAHRRRGRRRRGQARAALHPAQRAHEVDGLRPPGTHAGAPSSSNANAPPYGVRFRLKAGFDETPTTPARRSSSPRSRSTGCCSPTAATSRSPSPTIARASPSGPARASPRSRSRHQGRRLRGRRPEQRNRAHRRLRA